MKRLSFALCLASLFAGCGGTPKPTTPDAGFHLDPPSQGFQLEVPAFQVAEHTETQRCFFFEVPSDVPVFVRKFEIAQTPGTHHMNVFRVRTVKALGGKAGDSVVDGECWKSGNWADWPLVVNSQESGTHLTADGGFEERENTGYTDWTMPDGVAMRFEPHELVMLQTHYVNGVTQRTATEGNVLVNFHTEDPSKVTDEVGTAFATNQNIRICPGDQGKFFEATCRIARSKPVKIIAANSHFHSRGDDFKISLFTPDGAPHDPFYESQSWSHPPMEWDLNIDVPAGGGVRYRCQYSAPSDSCGDPANSCCYTFGPNVDQNEHCNVFVYYYPKDVDVGCF